MTVIQQLDSELLFNREKSFCALLGMRRTQLETTGQLPRVRLEHLGPDRRVHLLPVPLGLHQARPHQLLHVVGNGGLRHRKLMAELLIGALVILGDGLEQAEAPRIGERLGDPVELAGGQAGRVGSVGEHSHITI